MPTSRQTFNRFLGLALWTLLAVGLTACNQRQNTSRDSSLGSEPCLMIGYTSIAATIRGIAPETGASVTVVDEQTGASEVQALDESQWDSDEEAFFWQQFGGEGRFTVSVQAAGHPPQTVRGVTVLRDGCEIKGQSLSFAF